MGTAIATVLAVAAVDIVGEAVAMEAVVARIAEKCIVAARGAWVSGKVIADDLGIVPSFTLYLVVAALAADRGLRSCWPEEPNVVSHKEGIVPLARRDLVVSSLAAHGFVGAAVPDYNVGLRTALDLVVSTVAAYDAYGGAPVVSENNVDPRAPEDFVIPPSPEISPVAKRKWSAVMPSFPGPPKISSFPPSMAKSGLVSKPESPPTRSLPGPPSTWSSSGPP